MNLESIVKFFRTETKFSLKIGQKKNGMKDVSWCVISRNKRSAEFLGRGDLSAADIKKISEEIGEDEMFIFGSFNRKPKVVRLDSIILFLPLDERGLEGIIVRGKIYQVTGRTCESEYPLDDKQLKEYNEGKRNKDQIEYVRMTDLTIERARKIFWEFINS